MMDKRLPIFKVFLIFFTALLCGGGLLLVLFGANLKDDIRSKFDGQKWQLPAIVYARPLELFPGKALSANLLVKELELAGYRNEKPVTSPGGFFREENRVHLKTRNFHFPGGLERSIELEVGFTESTISSLTKPNSKEHLTLIRLDPARIGSFHPLIHEDRQVLKPEEIPPLLKTALITVEDQNFNSHYGIAPLGILRALLANIKARRTVQGGSTITQQLVKNFFLERERTFSRKFKEAIMAVLLEYYYTKEDIFTAYVNEVFLGQDGSRAIHGFGLASQFYFRRSLDDLSVAQTATLVGMVKGPSAYDPRNRKSACIARRNLVLQTLHDKTIISTKQYEQAKAEAISDVMVQKNGFNRFPAFLDLVRFQLRAEYKEEDLRGKGLKILTNLNPQVQWKIEQTLSQSPLQLESATNLKKLQGAVIVTSRESGEVEGLTGDIDPFGTGFNRALDASRPIGSLVKPAVYLSALASGYTLASPLMDTSISVDRSGKMSSNMDGSWTPSNYDNIEHGRVPLYLAMAKSYNLATVRLGMNVGLEKVIDTIQKLGFSAPLPKYPSLLLGATEMSPFQVSQIYQTIGSGGFFLPLRSINSVLTQDNRLLKRYGLQVEQRFSPALIFLLTHGLERVLSEGTGRSYQFHSDKKFFAGKTGTSNELKDSWFAGFSDSHVAVVWLGRDDNKPTGLSGSTGALRVWGSLLETLGADSESPQPEPTDEIDWVRIDKTTLKPARGWNTNTTELPFIRNTVPVTKKQQQPGHLNDLEQKTKNFFESLNRIFQ